MRKRLALLGALVLCLSACGYSEQGKAGESEENTRTIFAMDTVMNLTVCGGTEAQLDEMQKTVEQLESLLSVTEETSEVYRVNHTGEAELSPEIVPLAQSALALCERTEGALDLSVYPVLCAWGFTTGEYRVPSQQELERLLPLVDYSQIQLSGNHLSVPEGMELDFGSVAKGYTGDVLANQLKAEGITSALLNLGGNVQAVGAKSDGTPWRIGVQSPDGGEDYLGILTVEDEAVITSGSYERYFEEDGQRYWHIIDPATGAPAQSGLCSVTVVGASGVICDGLSTALFVMGLEQGSEFWRQSQDFEVIFVTEDGCVLVTEGLEDRFTLTDTARQEEWIRR